MAEEGERDRVDGELVRMSRFEKKVARLEQSARDEVVRQIGYSYARAGLDYMAYLSRAGRGGAIDNAHVDRVWSYAKLLYR